MAYEQLKRMYKQKTGQDFIPASERQESTQGLFADTVDAVEHGALSGVADIAEGVNRLTGGEDEGRVSRFFREWSDDQLEEMSPESREAFDNFGFEQKGDSVFDVGLKDGSSWRGFLLNTASGAGSFAPTMVPGGFAAKGIGAAGKVLGGVGKGTKAGKYIDRAADAIAYPAANAGMTAGGTANQAKQQIESADFNDLVQAPIFQHAYYQNKELFPELSHEDLMYRTRTDVANEIANAAAVDGAKVGALSMAAFGPTFGKIFSGGSKSLKSAIGSGAATEATQEALESGGQTAVTNAHVNDVTPIETSNNVVADALTGVITGGPIGGAMGGATHSVASRFNKAETPEDIDAIINEDLSQNPKSSVLENIDAGIEEIEERLLGDQEGIPQPLVSKLAAKRERLLLAKQRLSGESGIDLSGPMDQPSAESNRSMATNPDGSLNLSGPKDAKPLLVQPDGLLEDPAFADDLGYQEAKRRYDADQAERAQREKDERAEAAKQESEAKNATSDTPMHIGSEGTVVPPEVVNDPGYQEAVRRYKNQQPSQTADAPTVDLTQLDDPDYLLNRAKRLQEMRKAQEALQKIKQIDHTRLDDPDYLKQRANDLQAARKAKETLQKLNAQQEKSDTAPSSVESENIQKQPENLVPATNVSSEQPSSVQPENQSVNPGDAVIEDVETVANDVTEVQSNGESLKAQSSDTLPANEPTTSPELDTPKAETIPDVGDKPELAQIKLLKSGTPFSTEKVTRLSKTFRDNPGAEVVPVKGGFGIKLPQPKTESEKTLQAKTSEIEQAASETNTSPTEAQIKADNYKKGRIKLHGLNIAIENPKGSTRSGTDQDGKQWESTMAHHYGDIKGVKGADGDDLDVFIGENPESEKVFVIDQVNPKTREFDEHKVMIGFDTKEAAESGYLENYEDGWGGNAGTTEMTVPELKEWIESGDTNKPAGQQDRTANDKRAKAGESEEKITDFGEKLGGARKDVWGGLLEQNNADLASSPLSKSFPEPDYKKAAESGESAEKLALVAALRASIPAKPRNPHKLSRWSESVEQVRSIAGSVLSGDLNEGEIIQSLRSKGGALQGIANAIPAISKASPENMKEAAKYRINSGRFTIFDGKKLDKPANYYFVEKDGKTDYRSASPNLEEVQDYLAKQIEVLSKPSKSSKESNIGVYVDRQSKQAYLGWKGASGVLEIQEFPDSKSARAYLSENRQDVERRLQQLKKNPSMRRDHNEERIGQARRKGNVAPKEFSDSFGFRGVEFGNWVEEGKRQRDLNDAFDGLTDMAEVLNIPPRAISLNGELGLAFGSRGRGGKNSAKAHYEPDYVAINLTKKDGAGSLAHEWWHALDNYFSRARGEEHSYVTKRPYPSGNNSVRQEVLESINKVMAAIKRSDLPDRARELDKRRSKAYWSTDVEMSARAFESYIISKLKSKDASNDYLANIVTPEYWDAAESLGLESNNSYPYLLDAEMESVNKAFDELFQTLQTKETDKGLALFSIKDNGHYELTDDGFVAIDGNPDLGEIDQSVASEIKRQPGPIRLEEGNAMWGLRHISRSTRMAEIRKAGYEKAEDIVRDVAENYNEVRKGDRGTLMLVKRNGKDKVAYIKLKPHKSGDYYSVSTAMIARKDFTDTKERLWGTAQSIQQAPMLPSAISGQSLSSSVAGTPAQQSSKEELPISVAESDSQSIKEDSSESDTNLSVKEERTTGMNADDLRKSLQPLIDDYGEAETFKVINSMRDLPIALRLQAKQALSQSKGKDAKLRGLNAGKMNYLIADQISNPKEGAEVFLHEVLGHKAVLDMLGKDGDPIMERIAISYGANGMSDIMRNYGLDLKTRENRIKLGKEKVAHMAETGEKPALFGRLVAVVKNWLRKYFPNLKWTDNDVKALLASAEKRATQKHFITLDEVGEEATSGSFLNASIKSAAMDRLKRKSEQPKTKVDKLYATLGQKDKTIEQKIKDMAKRQFKAGGMLPDSVFSAKIERDGKMNEYELDIAANLNAFRNAVKKAYGKSYDELTEYQKVIINRQLGETKSNPRIPTSVRAAIANFRSIIDQQSAQYAEMLENEVAELRANGSDQQAQAKADLLETISGNMETYTHRSYKAFDDPKWPQKVPKETLENAVDHIKSGYLGQGMDVDEAENKAIRTARAILEEGTAYEDLGSFIKESKLGAKDLSTLKRRKAIAPEIRALLGEYTDIEVNFAKTVSKMSRLIANQAFLKRVLELGQSEGFLFDEDNKPLGKSVTKIAAEGSEVLAPLNGLYTYPEIEQAFRDALGQAEKGVAWVDAMVRMNGLIKYGKTVLSPTTAMRNIWSAFFFTVANGHFNVSELKKSFSVFSQYFGGDTDKAKLDYLKKLKRLGVIYDSPYAGEMMDLLKDSQIEQTLVDNKPLSKIKRLNQFAQKFYQYGDDMWKIVGFENEKAMLMKYKGMSEAQADKEAAERIRNTYPTYSMIGRFTQSLRRFPLAGTFVSFPAEIIRTSYHMLRYLKQDMKDSPAYARKKIAGLATVSAAAFAAQAISKAMLGISDDEEEAVRDMAPEWSKNSNVLFLGRDEKGNIQYIDLSFLDPYNYFKRPINALLRDQSASDIAAQSASEMLTPFFGEDIGFGALLDVYTNKKDTGGKVFNEQDTPLNQLSDITNHLRKSFQPGVISNMDRMLKAIDGNISKSGKEYKVSDELIALFGFRSTTVDPKTALYYRAFDFKQAKADANKVLKDLLRDPNKVSEDDLRNAQKIMLRARERTYQQMIRLVKSAKAAGMSNHAIASILKLGGVSKMDIYHLIQGRIPREDSIAKVARIIASKARMLYGDDVANDMVERAKSLH